SSFSRIWFSFQRPGLADLIWRRDEMKKLLPLLALAGALAMSLPAMAQTARLGYVPTEDHPVGKASVFFAEKVKEKTGGRITIETFGNGVLGSEPQLQSSIQGGFLDVMVGPTS